jgi:hypothetical protein
MGPIAQSGIEPTDPLKVAQAILMALVSERFAHVGRVQEVSVKRACQYSAGGIRDITHELGLGDSRQVVDHRRGFAISTIEHGSAQHVLHHYVAIGSDL